jgi:hypothetical protein
MGCSSISRELSLLDSKHVTLLPSRGCSSPNSLKVRLLFRFLRCSSSACYLHCSFVLMSDSSVCDSSSLNSSICPHFFQSARPEHFRGVAVVSHLLFRFIHCSFILARETGTSTTSSSNTGRFPFFVLEGPTPPWCPLASEP